MCTVGERGSCILRELQTEDISEVSPDVIGTQLEALRRHINACEAEFSRQLQRFDKGEGYSADGALSARAWLRWKCHLSPAAASDRVQTARRLASLELTEAAFAAGEISYAHAARRGHATQRRRPEAAPDSDHRMGDPVQRAGLAGGGAGVVAADSGRDRAAHRL